MCSTKSSDGKRTTPVGKEMSQPVASTSERPHKCSYCPQAFTKAAHLTRHERSHTAEKPFVCIVCSKTFSRSDVMSKHLKTHDASSAAANRGQQTPDGNFKRMLWMDCDPGHDDALALLSVSHSANIFLLGISTVFGNTTVKNTSLNAARCLSAYGVSSDIKVYRGASQPLVRTYTDVQILGDDGLRGAEGFPKASDPSVIARLPEGVNATAVKAFESTALRLLLEGLQMTYLATGPLTNLAIFILALPDLCKRVIREINVMGGAINTPGNSNLSITAEWNIFSDPESAHIVFNSLIPIRLFPLDITNTATFRPEVEWANLRSETASSLRQALSNLLFSWAATVESPEGPPIHDLVPAIYSIDPLAFTGDLIHLKVELADLRHLGRTTSCAVGEGGSAQPIWVGKSFDRDRLFSHFFTALERAEQAVS